MSHDQRQADEAIGPSREVKSDGATSQRERRAALSLPQILAGALAAASAAAAASSLGLAGTVLGAVVASIVVPVGTALYSHPLERSARVIRGSLPPRPERTGSAGEPASGSAGIAQRHRPVNTPGSSGMSTRRRIRWGAVAVSCLLVLVVGFGALTALEAVMGKPVSSLTGSDRHGGSTTVGRLLQHGSSGTGSQTKQTGPIAPGSQGAAPSNAGTGAPTTDAPTTEPPPTAQATTAPTTTAPATTAPATTAPATDPATSVEPTPNQTTGIQTPTPTQPAGVNGTGPAP